MLCCDLEQGPDALYQQHGDALAAEIKAAGGIVTADDLRNASPIMKEPVTIQVSNTCRICMLSRFEPSSLSSHPLQMT
jgi:gamma-glutamyltranspeptidase